MKTLLVKLWKDKRGALTDTAIAFVVLVCAVVIGLFIVHQVESAMLQSGFNSSSTWWTPYSNFVEMMKIAFPVLGVAALVTCLLWLLIYLISAFRGVSAAGQGQQ